MNNSVQLTICLLFSAMMYVSADTYYVTPNQSDQACSTTLEASNPCSTLSKIAGKIFSKNTKLVFLPGTHIVSLNFTVNDVDYLELLAYPSHGTAPRIVKINFILNGIFNFVNITDIAIRGIEFTIGCSFGNSCTNRKSKMRRGGATFIAFSRIFIVNCTFKENSAVMGGAVYALYSNVRVSTSLFLNNRAKRNGGAIFYQNSSIEIDSSIFVNNTAEDNGGALSGWKGTSKFSIRNSNVTINNSLFINNYARWGGALNHQNVNIFMNNCSLHNNMAKHNGGALVHKHGSIKMANTTFSNNRAINKDGNGGSGGGAVYALYSNVRVSTSLFLNNRAKRNGGAIFYQNSSIEIDSSIFVNNTAEDNGGALSGWKGTSKFSIRNSNVTINNSLFINNYVRWGGALNHQNVNISMNNCSLHNNMAKHNGGALVHKHGSIKMANTTFSNNRAINKDGNGGSGGGAIYHENVSVTMNRTIFTNNTAVYGGAINQQKDSLSDITISNSIFDTNRADFGGAILLQYTRITTVNSKFVNNIAREGGAALYKNSEVTIDSSVYINNIADPQGGAITCQNISATIVNSSFINNTASIGGGAIIIERTCRIVTIHNCSFSNNTASYGGAIDHWKGMCTIRITNSNFNFNSASKGGGAMMYENSTIQIYSSIFINNRAINWGGAMNQWKGACDVSINNSMFVNNTACYGGAINHQKSSILITKSKFARNYGIEGGGAVININSNVTLIGNKFIKNIAIWAGALDNINSSVAITESSFMDNKAYKGGGAMYHENSTVTVTNSTFINNTAKWGGAIDNRNSSGSTEINRSEFINNTAHWGGAIDYRNGNVTLSNCKFVENAALLGGGAITKLNCNVTLHNNIFINNTAHNGGAIHIYLTNLISYGSLLIEKNVAYWGVAYAIESDVNFTGNFTFIHNIGSLLVFSSSIIFSDQANISNNSHDTSSQISSGGAVSSFQSEIYFIGRTHVMYNQATNKSGGALSVTESKIYFSGNTTIAHNTALNGGGIHAYQSEIYLQGNNLTVIRSNTVNKKGGGIYAVGSTLQLSKRATLLIENNRAEKGGGMCLELNGKIYITKTLLGDFNLWTFYKENDTLMFSNNSAHYGGAIFISDDTNSGMCGTRGPSATSECFLQVLANYDNNYNISANAAILRNTHFIGNIATNMGNTLFGGLLDRCTVSQFSEIVSEFPQRLINAAWYLTALTSINEQDIESEVSSDPVRVCFCYDNLPNCSYEPPCLYVQKGETFTVTLVAVDQVNNVIPNTSIHSILSPQAGLGEGQSIQMTGDSCTELKYTISSPHDQENISVFAQGPCKDNGLSAKTFQMVFKSCPIGFKDSNSECICDPVLFDYIAKCSIDTETILRRNGTWISFVNNSVKIGYLLYKHCPFDYCSSKTSVWVNLNIPNGADAQCAFNRSGKLCGTCKNGLSLSLGSSRCRLCSNTWLLLLILFAIAGIALVAFVHVLNLTVLVGTINGLIFYANIVFSNRTTFMPFQESNFWTIFIAWLNLDFGFETCLFNGMDGYVKTWLQLAFPLYIISLVIILIYASQYSAKLTIIISRKRNPVATLATLVLLSYTKILRTIIAALSFARLEYPEGSFETVWLIDANIQYFEWKHILLIFVSIIILIIGVLFTSLLLLWQCLQRCPNKKPVRLFTYSKLYSFMDVYLAPYNVHHRYYMGTLLLIRAILYLVSALTNHLDPSYTLVSIIILMTCLMAVCSLMNVFKQQGYKVLENLFLSNLIILASCTYHVKRSGGNQAILAQTSISISFITMLLILSYHLYVFVLQNVFEIFRNRQRNRLQHQPSYSQPLIDVTSEDEVLQPCDSYTEVNALPSIFDTDSSDYEQAEETCTTVNIGNKKVECFTTQPETLSEIASEGRVQFSAEYIKLDDPINQDIEIKVFKGEKNQNQNENNSEELLSDKQ